METCGEICPKCKNVLYIDKERKFCKYCKITFSYRHTKEEDKSEEPEYIVGTKTRDRLSGARGLDIVIPHQNVTDYIQDILKNIHLKFNVYIVRAGNFGENCNKGAYIGKEENIMFLNDDTYIPKQVLDEAMNISEYADIVGIPQYIPNQDANIDGVCLFREPRKEDGFYFDYAREREKIFFPHGFCYIIKRKLFEELEGYDERYRNAMEDCDLFLKAIQKKAIICYAKTRVTHYLSKSLGRKENESENQKRFRDKWSFADCNKIRDNMDKISVIVTTIPERKELLKTTIASIKQQTFTNIEIITILDEEHKGVAWARNEGIKKATGNYILWCDDDITWNKHAFGKMLRALKDSNASFSYGHYRVDSAILSKYNEIFKSCTYDFYHATIMPFIPTMSLVKREVIQDIKWDNQLKRLLDWDFFLTLSERGFRGIKIPETLFSAYYDPKTSVSINQDLYSNEWKVRNKHFLTKGWF